MKQSWVRQWPLPLDEHRHDHVDVVRLPHRPEDALAARARHLDRYLLHRERVQHVLQVPAVERDLRRDSRVSVVFDGGDGIGAVTVRGTVEFVDDLPSLVRVVLAVGRRDGLSEEQLAQRVRAARPGGEYVARLNPEGFVTFSHKKIVRG